MDAPKQFGIIVQVPGALALSDEVKPRAKVAYMALAAHGWEPDVPTDVIAELMGASWLTAHRAIHDLQAGGWIADDRTPVDEKDDQ